MDWRRAASDFAPRVASAKEGWLGQISCLGEKMPRTSGGMWSGSSFPGGGGGQHCIGWGSRPAVVADILPWTGGRCQAWHGPATTELQ